MTLSNDAGQGSTGDNVRDWFEISNRPNSSCDAQETRWFLGVV